MAAMSNLECWDDPDQLEAALEHASELSQLFVRRDHAQGRYAPTYGTSSEVIEAHSLYCLLYDRLETVAPERLVFAGSGAVPDDLDLEEELDEPIKSAPKVGAKPSTGNQ